MIRRDSEKEENRHDCHATCWSNPRSSASCILFSGASCNLHGRNRLGTGNAASITVYHDNSAVQLADFLATGAQVAKTYAEVSGRYKTFGAAC